MCSKTHFYMARLEEALDLLLKYEEVNSALEKNGMECMECMTSFIATICELIHHKAAGNKSFQEGRHAEVVEQYTTTFAFNGESWSITSVFLQSSICNYFRPQKVNAI